MVGVPAVPAFGGPASSFPRRLACIGRHRPGQRAGREALLWGNRRSYNNALLAISIIGLERGVRPRINVLRPKLTLCASVQDGRRCGQGDQSCSQSMICATPHMPCGSRWLSIGSWRASPLLTTSVDPNRTLVEPAWQTMVGQ